jgi:hypothetical protein
MRTRIAQQLVEFAKQRRAGEIAAPGRRPEVPRAALCALALLPFQRLFAGAGVSSKIKDFVYTLS